MVADLVRNPYRFEGGYDMRAYDFSPLFRYSVGFDRLEQLLDAASRRQDQAPSYPPYNIESVDENAYRITMAVAGFGEQDLDITLKESSLVVPAKAGRPIMASATCTRGSRTAPLSAALISLTM